jgi:hypothetical protein
MFRENRKNKYLLPITATDEAGVKTCPQVEESAYLGEILDELTLMQNSEDLLERYQVFVRMAQKSLNHVLGCCAVSLWCPEHDYRNLIECVIRPGGEPVHGGLSSSSNNASRRDPCRMPIDSQVIRDTLKTGKPYLASASSRAALVTGNAEDSLRTDACLVLYREYGQPLLINAELIGVDSKGGDAEAFPAAVRLINLFWRQLQAANQRQWLAEHDEPSRALRDEVFLRQAQEWASNLSRRDELFALVVITMQGFRSMFAGSSDQWRCLSGLLGRCLQEVIGAQGEKFLLGKMADDVFALVLADKDVFLADVLMRSVVEKLGPQMNQDTALSTLNVLAVDIQWSIADHKQYQGDMERLLNKVYRRLFTRAQNKHRNTHRIVLEDESSEVALQRWK